MSKILVTGGCGFLGSHICEYYRKQEDEVVSIDNLTKYELMRTGYNVEGARLHNWNYLKELGVELYESDIKEPNKQYIDSIWHLAKDCDFICHTAAQPSMTISIENPVLDFENNVLGTLNVLEAARRYDIPIVNCSSIHVYGNWTNKILKEEKTKFSIIGKNSGTEEWERILQGDITPLHASKRAGEIYTQAYVDTYGLKAASFRLTGMYGERQFGGEDHGWVANFVIRTLLKLPITIYGTDKQVRDILYVKDAVEAFDAFYKHQKSGIYNIGGGIEQLISLKECLSLIQKITYEMGIGIEAGIPQDIIFDKARKGDLWYFCCNTDKAEKELGWKPKTSNENGLRKLIGWIKKNMGLFRR